MKGNATAQTAAKPYALPFPFPDAMYLRDENSSEGRTREFELSGNYQSTVPSIPPKNVAIIRATRPNVVSPLNLAIVS